LLIAALTLLGGVIAVGMEQYKTYRLR